MNNHSLIKPLQIGRLSFQTNLIQAPLAGVSCAPFRALIWQHSEPAFACTEMISCKTLIHQKEMHKRFVTKASAERAVCFQLSGSEPHELAEAVKIATDYGADLIDLNCGCPVKKIRSRGAGSSLLTQPTRLYHLIKAMKQHTTVPVSIKIRVESDKPDKFNAQIAQVVQDAGADFLIVHGRHWTEHYETPCDHHAIQFFVEALKTIPVIGNGDVACAESLKKMLATGCAGAMIGRAGVGQPWLMAKLAAELQGEAFVMPAPRQVGAMFMQHARELAALLGNETMAILQVRKLAKYYARALANKADFCLAVNACLTLNEFEQLCQQAFCEGAYKNK